MDIDNIQGGVYTPDGDGDLFVCLNPESIKNLGKEENIDILVFVIPEYQERVLKVLRFSLIENEVLDELFNNFSKTTKKDIESYVRKKYQLSNDNKKGILSSNEKLEGEIIMGFRSIFAEFENTIIIEITRKLLERLLEHITGKEASHGEIDILSGHKIDGLDGYTYQYNTGKQESHTIDFYIKSSKIKQSIQDEIKFFAQLKDHLNPDGTYKYNGICNIPQILNGGPKENL